MDQFISLREFCLLKDPITPAREIQHVYLKACDRRGWGVGRDLVARYDLAKEAWERFGDTGPPVGSQVFYLHWNRLMEMFGPFVRDPRFLLIGTKGSDPVNRRCEDDQFLIDKEVWWYHILPGDCSIVTDQRPHLRWEDLRS